MSPIIHEILLTNNNRKIVNNLELDTQIPLQFFIFQIEKLTSGNVFFPIQLIKFCLKRNHTMNIRKTFKTHLKHIFTSNLFRCLNLRYYCRCPKWSIANIHHTYITLKKNKYVHIVGSVGATYMDDVHQYFYQIRFRKYAL